MSDTSGDERPPHQPASAEVARFARASADLWGLWVAVRYLIHNRPDIRYFRAYREYGDTMFKLDGIEEFLSQPGDTHLSILAPVIEPGVVAVYARLFTEGRGAGYPLPESVLPDDPELRAAHFQMLDLRHKAVAHIDATDSPAPRIVERFPDINDQGVVRWRFQSKGGFVMFSEGQLELLERLMLAVAKNVDAHLTEAKRAELSALPACADCGRGPLEDGWPTVEGRERTTYIVCPECFEQATAN